MKRHEYLTCFSHYTLTARSHAKGWLALGSLPGPRVFDEGAAEGRGSCRCIEFIRTRKGGVSSDFLTSLL